MTSEASENTIFVRLYFTQCFLLSTDWKLDLWLHCVREALCDLYIICQKSILSVYWSRTEKTVSFKKNVTSPQIVEC